MLRRHRTDHGATQVPRTRARHRQPRQQRHRSIINTPARCSAGTNAINRDRAAVAVTRILQIVALAPRRQLRPQLEDLLRDEFAQIANHAAADRQLVD
jgi:hypothetical protein